MASKYFKIIFYFLLVTLLFVWFSPLDYTNLTFAFFHLWLTIICGAVFIIAHIHNKKTRKKSSIASIIGLTIFFYVSFDMFVNNPNNEIEISKTPDKKMIITCQNYSAFMIGNMRMDISIGYPIIGELLIWRVNKYLKDFDGDSEKLLTKYTLPKGINQDNFGLYILEKENYLLNYGEWGGKRVYRVTVNQ